MKTFEEGQRYSRVVSILTRAEALKVKIPASVQAKRNRADKLQNLIRPITNEEIQAATTDTVDVLIARVRDNAVVDNPSANREFARMREAFNRDLFDTLAGCVWQLYNDVAGKLDKSFVKVNVTAAKVPYAFAANPATWDRYDDATRNALTSLRDQAKTLVALGEFLNVISETFYPALPAPREVAALSALHLFYDFGGFDSPTLAELQLPEAGSLDVETITYLAERGVKLRAQTIKDRRATEKALIDQARSYAQLDDGTFVPFAQAPIRQDPVNTPPAYVERTHW